MNNIPIVTVVCTVYNHAKYLRECLDGFVMQKTGFHFEVIVHDDCSTDNSQVIIQEYAEKYPKIIKPIYQKENQYSKHDGSLTRAINPYIKGRYVAICEGDDYWTDPLKLQTQYDFLETHLDCSLCFHNVNVKWENKPNFEDSLYSHLKDGYFDIDTIISKWTIPTCSAFMRSYSYINKPYDKRFIVGDNVLWMQCAKDGKIYCINRKMATYRRSDTGWVFKSYGKDKHQVLNNYIKYLDHLYALQYHFPNVATIGVNDNLKDYLARICVLKARFRHYDLNNYIVKGWSMYRIGFIKECVRRIVFYIRKRI